MLDVDAIQQVVREVWTSMLSMDVEFPGPWEAPLERPTITGVVGIAGPWEGAVSVECSVSTARLFTASLMAMNAEDLAPADVQDAIGELANVVGGNLKSLLPGPSQLSLPMVIEGFDYSTHLPGTSPTTRVVGLAGRAPVLFTLFARVPSGATP